ncbi:MAG: HDOD domain-containing protein, partial [Acidimicrobiia bacterium]
RYQRDDAAGPAAATGFPAIADCNGVNLPAQASAWTEWIRSGEWASDDKAAVPMLPANVQELVVLAVDPDVALWKVAGAVGKDPVLAAQVMRMANTVGVTPGRAVVTIDEAVRRLGSQAVRNVVLAGCLSTQMADPRVYGNRGREIADHCLGTAIIAGKLSERVDLSGELFLAGLLHDIGKLLVLKLAYEYEKETGSRPGHDAVEEILRVRHAQLGGWLAVRWQIPEAITECIIWHHDPEWAADRQSVAIIYAANRLAHRYGFGCELDRSNLLTDPTMVEAGVDDHVLAKLDLAATKHYEDMRRALPDERRTLRSAVG